MSIWDDPEMKVNDDFVKFDTIGDTVTGTILHVKAHRFDDNNDAPQILLRLDDGAEKTVTAGQVRLKAALADKRPEAGDRITITLSNIEARGGGKTLKHFDVAVVRGNGATAAPAAPAQAATPEGPDPQALAAAVANLSPEQKAALGLPI
jgi:hypothetical protein